MFNPQMFKINYTHNRVDMSSFTPRSDFKTTLVDGNNKDQNK